MSKTAAKNAKSFVAAVLLAAAGLVFFACAMPDYNLGLGSIDITARLPEDADAGSASIARYVYTGQGPGGKSFSVESSSPKVLVEELQAGEWLVQASGYNSNGIPVLKGSNPEPLSVFGKTRTEINMAPEAGRGALKITAAWTGTAPASPSASATVTAPDGTSSAVSLEQTGSASAETTIDGLEAGVYNVKIKLYDEGTLSSENTKTVLVLSSTTAEASASCYNEEDPGTPPAGQYERITVAAESFVIAWESDSAADEYYRIYARPFNSGTGWTLVGQIEASPAPEFEINTSNLEYGTWEFAVSALRGSEESELHASTDPDASPSGGWYVDWIRP